MMGLLVVVITVTTLELVWLLVKDIATPTGLLLEAEEMFELFGFFLLVLIGMELLATLRSYIYERVVPTRRPFRRHCNSHFGDYVVC